LDIFVALFWARFTLRMLIYEYDIYVSMSPAVSIIRTRLHFRTVAVGLQRSGTAISYAMSGMRRKESQQTRGNDGGRRIDDNDGDWSVMGTRCRRYDVTTDATDDAEVASG